MVAEGLSRFLDVAKCYRGFKGLQISQVLYITDFLFIDDILIFCDGSMRDTKKLAQGLNIFQKIAGMQANE